MIRFSTADPCTKSLNKKLIQTAPAYIQVPTHLCASRGSTPTMNHQKNKKSKHSYHSHSNAKLKKSKYSYASHSNDNEKLIISLKFTSELHKEHGA